MSANIELGALLMQAPESAGIAKELEDMISQMGETVKTDTIPIQGKGRYKTSTTVAALLAYSRVARQLLTHSELDSFDAIVAKVRQRMLELEGKNPPGMKISNALYRTAPPPF